MNQESVVTKTMLLELFSSIVQVKHKDECTKKTSKFPRSFISGWISFKVPESMAIITSIITAHVYIEILDNFPIPLINN